MARQALHRHAVKHHAGLSGKIVVRVLCRPVRLDLAHPEVRRTICEAVARRADDFAHHLVVRFAGLDGVVDVRVVRVTAGRKFAAARRDLHILDEIAEPHRPPVDEGIRSEKRVDRLRPFVGGLVVEKSLHGGRIGDLAGEVEIHPAKEFFVRGDRRRRDAVRFHLPENLVVDVVHRRRINGSASWRRLDRAAPAARSDRLGGDRELVV